MSDIGDRLRAVRMLHNVSQRELGTRSGVSNAMISLIENDKTMPSISSLKKILAAIPMTVSEFFTFDVEQTANVFCTADEMVEVGTGAVSFRQVSTDLHDRKLQVFVETYPPASGTGSKSLQHRREEAGVIVSGHIEATIGTESRTLRAGDAFHFESHIPHRFRNTGKEACVLISARTPPSF